MAEIASFGVNVDQNTRLAQNAQDTANDANAKNSANSQQIANINDPNYLTPFEKPQLEIQMDNFATIYAADKDIATAEGIDFTAYDAAYQAYLAYMKPLTADISTYSPIVRTTFNSLVTAVQNAKTAFDAATKAQYTQAMDKAKTDIANGQSSYAAMKQDVATMKSNASSAVATANSTASGFGKVSQKADSAVASALSAESDASAAVTQATSAVADSKDAKQIAGAVSQSYKTLTDGSTMTIAELEGGLAAKLTKTDLNGYATETWAQNQINISANGINGTISSIKSTVDGHTTSINDLQADSSGFKAQFTTVNDTIGKHTTDIGTLQADSSGFKTQFQTVNDNVGKNATDIGTLQATSKELTTGFNTLTADNGTNKNDISQLKQTSKEVNSTLETVQTQVQNSAVGTNLYTDTQNFDNLASWWASGHWTKTTDTYKGLAVMQTTQDWNGLSQYIQVKKGDILTYSAYVKYASGTGKSRIYWQLNQSTEGSYSTATANPQSNVVTITDSWQRVSSTTVATSDGYLRPRLERGAQNSNTLQIAGIKVEKGSLSTDWCANPADNATVTALMQVKQTADGAEALATNNKGDITSIQETAKGLQSSVNSKASSDQLTQLSDQLTNKISDLSSSTSSQFTQTFKDINGLVKKGDVVNQFNLDTGGILLDTSGNSTKIVFSSPNIIFDSKNPVQIPNANIPGKLTGKTFEAGTITATTKINGADIEAPLIHSPNNSFKLDGNTGDIVGPSIHSADGAWGITANGKISGTSVTSSLIDISGDGSGPNFDAENVTPDTATGIYSRYKYTNPNVGFDVNGMGRKMYKNGYLVINGDTFLNRTIGDWSADGGGKYVYDTMYEANVIKMRAYNFTGSNVQMDDPSKTQGAISSRLDIQPSAITMGPDWSVSNPNILLDRTGRIKGGLIATNAAHSIGTTDGRDLYFMKMNKDATNVGGSSIPIHVKGLYTSNLGMNNGHTISSFDGGGIYVKDTYNGGGHMVDLHVKKLYQSSLLSLKTDIKPIDPHEALTEVVKNDVMGYHFKNDKTTDPKSVSVILDDINPIPKYYTSDVFKSADGAGRNDGNIVGYLMLSIKDLNNRLQKLEGAN